VDNRLILHIRDLNKKYDKFALKDINIELPTGSIMGFIGPNGAGKSTTIKSILNIIPFDSGRILINGMDNIKDEIKTKQIIGYVGEQLNLYNEVSAYKIYKFVKKYYPEWDDSFFHQLVNKFGLDLNKRIKELSKGTGVKFALSLALSHHPELLVLDEPTSGLDPVVRNEVLDILLGIVNTEGCSVFFSSHITEDIVKVADYVTYINDGTILLSDSKKNILENYKSLEFADDIPESVKRHLKFYRNNTAIINNLDELLACCSKEFNGSKVVSRAAALDDILLFLIEEDAAHAELNS